MAAKFFTGLPLDGPDPECALGHGEALLAARRPQAAATQGQPRPFAPTLTATSGGHARPDRACDENPLAGFTVKPG